MIINEKIVKPEYILFRNAYTTFDNEGQKVFDETREGYIMLQTTKQKMFFPIQVAKNLVKDLAMILAEKRNEK